MSSRVTDLRQQRDCTRERRAPGEAGNIGSRVMGARQTAENRNDQDQGPPPILEVRGLYKSFGAHQVLRGIDLRIETGLTTVIIGGSGSGKSVLLKHLIGLLRPERGEVYFHGEDVFSLPRQALLGVRSKFGMLFQNSALFDSMTVFDNIAFPLREHQRSMSPSAIRDTVLESLHELNLYGVEQKFPAELSGGMRKRVALARATVVNVPVAARMIAVDGLPAAVRKTVGMNAHQAVGAKAPGMRV